MVTEVSRADLWYPLHHVAHIVQDSTYRASRYFTTKHLGRKSAGMPRVLGPLLVAQLLLRLCQE